MQPVARYGFGVSYWIILVWSHQPRDALWVKSVLFAVSETQAKIMKIQNLVNPIKLSRIRISYVPG